VGAENTHRRIQNSAKEHLFRNFYSTLRKKEMSMSGIITSDESRVHHYGPLTKRRSMISRHQSSPRKKKFKMQTTKSRLTTTGTLHAPWREVRHSIPSDRCRH
jgi:hypothetical protein